MTNAYPCSNWRLLQCSSGISCPIGLHSQGQYRDDTTDPKATLWKHLPVTATHSPTWKPTSRAACKVYHTDWSLAHLFRKQGKTTKVVYSTSRDHLYTATPRQPPSKDAAEWCELDFPPRWLNRRWLNISLYGRKTLKNLPQLVAVKEANNINEIQTPLKSWQFWPYSLH